MSAALTSKNRAASGESPAKKMQSPSPLDRQVKAPWADTVFAIATKASAFVTLALLFGIMASLVYAAWPAMREYGLDFLFTNDWNPGDDIYGGLGPITGTLVSSVIALVIGVPISFGIALFLTELAPTWLKRPLGTAIELLAAIPSIVYGMWAYFLFVNWPGHNMLTAGLVLAVMVIPFIASVMRDVFEVTPSLLKESAYGVGCTTWEVMWKVVLPYTKAGVIGGIMLGLGRALGETMAVTFVIGNNNYLNFEDFSLTQAGSSITSVIANEFAESSGMHQSSLMYLGLVLFFITFVVLSASKLLLLRLKRSEGKSS